MKANELRVGNWVKWEDEEIQIEYFLAGDIAFRDVAWTVGIEELKPIPLDEDWLEKLGFNNKDISYHLDIAEYHIKMFFYDCWHFVLSSKFEDAYLTGYWNVNEFQNLIHSLTQQELTPTK